VVRKSYQNGGEGDEVGEPNSGDRTVIWFEFEEYPEAKVLLPIELRALHEVYGSHKAVARIVGTSRVFVTENVEKSSSQSRDVVRRF
jgi:hypothetical protein